MDEDVAHEVWAKIKNRKLETVMGLSGLFLLVMGVGEWRRAVAPKTAVEIVEEVGEEVEDNGEVVVDVSGAVGKPGVYRMTEGARVGEVIDLAGGLRTEADVDYVGRSMNLAEELHDGAKVYVPFVGEEPFEGELEGGVVAGQSVVSVNQASKEVLMSLVGVGEVRAQQIIDNRPYVDLDELVSKASVPESVMEDNEGKLGL